MLEVGFYQKQVEGSWKVVVEVSAGAFLGLAGFGGVIVRRDVG